MGVIIYSFHLNMSPKMSRGMHECYCYVTGVYVYDFVIKKEHYLRWTPYNRRSNPREMRQVFYFK